MAERRKRGQKLILLYRAAAMQHLPQYVRKKQFHIEKELTDSKKIPDPNDEKAISDTLKNETLLQEQAAILQKV